MAVKKVDHAHIKHQTMKRKQEAAELDTTEESATKVHKDDITWSASQLRAIEAVRSGRNVFITGPGGVGKSFLVKHLIKVLEAKGKTVQVTASTGIAALPLDGITLHSHMNIGLGDTKKVPFDKMVAKMHYDPIKYERIKKVNVLIIDEISMLCGDYLEVCNKVLKVVRKNPTVFGNCQVIICGDFLQLPPPSGKFCFEAPVWKELKLVNIVLDEVFRQEDKEFVGMLNRIRFATPTPDDISILRSRVGVKLETVNGVDPTVMYSTNIDVDATNSGKLNTLGGEAMEFPGDFEYVDVDGVLTGCAQAVQLKRWMRLDLEKTMKSQHTGPITLKIGAQVVLLKNLERSTNLCNGSRGVVIGFQPHTQNPIVRFLSGIEHTVQKCTRCSTSKLIDKKWVKLTYEQYPLKLAFCITTHRAQGMSLDYVVSRIDGSIRSPGQCYTIFSRSRSVEGISLEVFNPAVIKADPKVLEFYKKLVE